MYKFRLPSTFFLFSLLFYSTVSYSQVVATLTGEITDDLNGEPLIGAVVIVSEFKDTTQTYGTTADLHGRFVFNNLEFGRYRLRVSYIGHMPLDTIINVNSANLELGKLTIAINSTLLDEILVQGQSVRQWQRGDTIEYNADAFKVNPNATAGDLIRKMPGMEVEGGRVRAQGEDVRRVTVDGQEFFGQDATIALQNLPAEIIATIQVFDRPGDQAQFTGFDDGEGERTINITTRPGMNTGQFGKITAGYGPDHRYLTGMNTNLFQGQRRISLIGLSNNINRQNFAMDESAGIVTPGFSRVSNGINNQSGIATVNSIGINYVDKWGEDISITGSYLFNHSNILRHTLLNRDFKFGNDFDQLYNEERDVTSKNFNHRLSLRMDYRIDSFNSILITPNLSVQNNTSENNFTGITTTPTELLNSIISSQENQVSTLNYNNNILFRRKFLKHGRTISLNLNNSVNSRNGENLLETNHKFKDDIEDIESLVQLTESYSNRHSHSAKISFTEPITEKSMLQLNYHSSFSRNNSEREAFTPENGQILMDTALSNVFDRTYTVHRTGMNYSLRDSSYIFSAGIDYLYAGLSGEQFFPYQEEVSRNFHNLLPTFTFQYRFSRTNNLRFFYRTHTSAPSVAQLQRVVNNSNPLLLSTGNPDIKPNYSHFAAIRYVNTNVETSRGFFVFVRGGITNNFIGNSIFTAHRDTLVFDGILLPRGSQLSHPQNLGTQFNLSSFFTYSLRFEKVKSNLNLNAGFSFNRTPGLINNQENINNHYGFNSGFNLSSNFGPNLDFNLSYSGRFNLVDNAFRPELNNNYFTHNSGAGLNWIFGDRFVISTEVNYISFSGLEEGFDDNFLLWNAGPGYKFLNNKRGVLKMNVFDILNTNKNINREITDLYIEDSRTNMLTRHVLITFTYIFRNFIGNRK